MATYAPLTINQGEDITIPLVFQRLTYPTLPWHATTNPYLPLDITGAEIEMMVRQTYDKRTPVLTFTNQGEVVRIVETDPENGKAELRIQAQDTTYTEDGGVRVKGDSWEGVYDLELSLDGAVKRCFYGEFTITREVTRAAAP